MFCIHCGIEYQAEKDRWGLIGKLCPGCTALRFKPKEKTIIPVSYCNVCGAAIHKKKITLRGKECLSSAGRFYCSSCKPLTIPQKPIRRCIVCDKELVRSTKYCQEHKPLNYPSTKKAHRKAALVWQRKNPHKVQASQFAQYNPALVYVLYECRCEHTQKHNHHFNYELKNIVIRLCPICHRAEHVRLRSLARTATAVAG